MEIAIQEAGKECKWLSSIAGELRTVDAGAGGKCDELVWVAAKGTKSWRVELREKLPKGRYTLYSRAVLANGLPEGKFTSGDHNLREVPRPLTTTDQLIVQVGPVGFRRVTFAAMRRAFSSRCSRLPWCSAWLRSGVRGGPHDPADQWLPRTDGAEWVYSWSNSDYQPTPRTEKYTVLSRAGTSFRLRWDEVNPGVLRHAERRHDRLPADRRRARRT